MKIYSKLPVAALSFIICHLSFSAALTSCQFEDEDFFDESASLRVEHTNDKVQQLLTAPEHGWVMQYFCGTGVAHFEGFNILARFDKGGKVTLASNHRYLRNDQAGKYTEASSLYQLLLEDGPVLALNTWNDVLTPFVDPVSPWQAPRYLNKDGAGMQGDNNFVIMKYSDDEILLRGERYSGRTRLIPCDRPWEEYLAACDSIMNYVTSNLITSYYIFGDTEDPESGTPQTEMLYITGLRNGGRLRYSERLDDPLKNDSLSAVFTPKGFRLERADTIAGNPFQEFFLSEDSTYLKTADGKVRIVSCWDNYIISTRTSVWNFNQEQFNDTQKELLEQIDAQLTKWNKNASLASVGLGRSSGSNAVKGLVITFYTNTAKTKTNTAGLALNMYSTGYGQMTIASDEDASPDRNMTSISAKSSVLELARQFVATLDGQYEIIPNNYFKPTECELIKVGGTAKYTLK